MMSYELTHDSSLITHHSTVQALIVREKPAKFKGISPIFDLLQVAGAFLALVKAEHAFADTNQIA